MLSKSTQQPKGDCDAGADKLAGTAESLKSKSTQQPKGDCDLGAYQELSTIVTDVEIDSTAERRL